MAGPGNILIRVGAEVGGAVSELGKVDKALGETQTTSQKMSAGLQKAALPAAAALAGIGYAAVDATKAAIDDAAAQEQLAGVLKRTTGATDAQISSTEDWISATARATGVADDELRPALGKLASATGDVGKAQDSLGVALDVSAATGKDVVAVSAAMAKGYDGSTGALYKMIPGLKSATGGSKDMTVVMAELADMTGGAMADAAGTASGQAAILENTMAELKETLGASLIPVVEAFLPVAQSMADFMSENTTLIIALVSVVAGLSAAILVANAAIKAYNVVTGIAKAATAAYTAVTNSQAIALVLYNAKMLVVKAATVAYTAVQWLLNAALTANPIGLVVAALAALAAALVIAWKHSETFRNIVTAAMNAVKSAVSALGDAFSWAWDKAKGAFNWIKDHWKVAAFAFGPIGVAVVAIANNFDALGDVAARVWGAIKSSIDAVGGAISSVVGKVQDLIGWLGKIHVPDIKLPNPFGKASSYALSPAAASSWRTSSTPASSSSGSGVVFNIYGAVDPEGTARAIRRILDGHSRRQGGLALRGSL